MPRANNNNGRRRNGRNRVPTNPDAADNVMNRAASSTVRVWGSITSTYTGASSSGNFRYNLFQITPTNFGTRLSAISDGFGAFRFRTLEVSAYLATVPDGTSAGWVVGFDPILSSVSTVPSATYDISEMQTTQFLSKFATTPVRMIALRGSTSGTLTKWFRTRATSTDDQFEYQGQIWYGCDNTTANPNIVLSFRFMIELKDPLPTPLTRAVELVGTWADVVERSESKSNSPRRSSSTSQVVRAVRK
jgi:hypothetical protein